MTNIFKLLYTCAFLFISTLGFAQATFSIQVDSLPSQAKARGLQISGETIICPGSITALKVEGQYASYQWSTGHVTPNITVYKPGSYSVTVTTSGGCSITGEVTVRYAAGPCL